MYGKPKCKSKIFKSSRISEDHDLWIKISSIGHKHMSQKRKIDKIQLTQNLKHMLFKRYY